VHKDLTEKDFRSIMDMAHRFYLEDTPPKNKALFVCQCYVKAVYMFLNSKSHKEEK
jgi:hypothetical protein